MTQPARWLAGSASLQLVFGKHEHVFGDTCLSTGGERAEERSLWRLLEYRTTFNNWL